MVSAARQKEAARRATTKAIESGKLVRPSRCSRCGDSGFIEAHHLDYEKPLIVEWLCRTCHWKAHGKAALPDRSGVKVQFWAGVDQVARWKAEAETRGVTLSMWLRRLADHEAQAPLHDDIDFGGVLNGEPPKGDREKVQMWAGTAEKARWFAHAARKKITFARWAREALNRVLSQESREVKEDEVLP